MVWNHLQLLQTGGGEMTSLMGKITCVGFFYVYYFSSFNFKITVCNTVPVS